MTLTEKFKALDLQLEELSEVSITRKRRREIFFTRMVLHTLLMELWDNELEADLAKEAIYDIQERIEEMHKVPENLDFFRNLKGERATFENVLHSFRKAVNDDTY